MLNLYLNDDDNYKFNHLAVKDQKEILSELQNCLKNQLNAKHIVPDSQFKKHHRLFKCTKDNRIWTNQRSAAAFYGINQCTLNFILHNRRPLKEIDLDFEYIDESR